jgi:hypothetical protein
VNGNWEAERRHKYTPPETDLELLRQADDFLDKIEADLPTAKERERAGDHYQVSDWLGNDTTTQDKLGFDYVRNDGIIVDGDDYIALCHVTPVRWSSKDTDGKMSIMAAYVSFLRSLQWGIAVPCYPTSFDLSGYIETIYTEGARRAAEGTHPILDYARRFHMRWISDMIDEDSVKKKEYYIVTRVNRDRVASTLNLPLQAKLRKVGRAVGLGGDGDDKTKQECINELNQRRSIMKTRLSRTGVEVERVTERQQTMELLYHYYNHVEPVLDEFDSSTFIQADLAQQ